MRASFDTSPGPGLTSFTTEGVIRLQQYSFRTNALMAVWIWKTDVAAVSIQLRTAGGPYEITESYLVIFRLAFVFKLGAGTYTQHSFFT